MSDDREVLSEAEATRLWQRAAELQAEEARRMEARDSADAESELAGDDGRTEGYALAHVRTAAVEAGIGEEFVEAALAEVRSERMARGTAQGGSGLARSFLGGPEEWVVARRRMQASPAEVLVAMEALFPREPYTLTLRERMGDPVRGGTLVFDIQGAGFSAAGQPGFRGDASFADLREVYVTLIPLSAAGGTEVVLRGPVAWAFALNAAISGLMTLVTGGIGMMGGMALGSGLLALGPAGLAFALGMGGGLGGFGGLRLFRSIYGYGQGRGRRALEALLSQVAAQAEGGWGLTPGGSTAALPSGED